MARHAPTKEDEIIHSLDRRGYDAFLEEVWPLIRSKLTSFSSTNHNRRTTDLYLLIGDIFDLYFDASSIALKYYRLAANLSPNSGRAWREKGNMLSYLGKHRAAFRAWKEASKLGYDDPFLAIDLASPPAKSSDRGGKIETSNRIWHKVSHSIATFHSRDAVRMLSGRTSVKAAQYRFRALAAMGESEKAIEQWEYIASQSTAIEITRVDWFFFRSSIWNDRRFWGAIMLLCDRIVGEVFPNDPFFEQKSRTRLQTTGQPISQKEMTRRWRLSAQFQIARISQDVPGLKKLCNRYPGWKLVQRAYQDLITC